MNLAFNCKKCKKRILYDPVTAKVTVTKMLERTTSSGMRFV
nr:MAG TPA: cysteine-rich protein [Caudoviricetes sp.]DAV57160.1 MAG TPA: cysteine-rich protein [Caudoviricetes sp.]